MISREDIKKFEAFLREELELEEATILKHVAIVEKIMRALRWRPSPEEIRTYVARVKESKSPSTYHNYVKALRRFFRDFLRRPEFVERVRWKVKPKPHKRITLPTIEDLRKVVEHLPDNESRALFLVLATSGLRKSEALNLTWEEIDWENRAILSKHRTLTKRGGVTFFNEEAAHYLEKIKKDSGKVFSIGSKRFRRIWKIASDVTGKKITPQILRIWFAMEMRKRGVPDSFIDIFQGRAPESVLTRYYTDPYALEMLKEVYDRAGLRIGITKVPYPGYDH